MIPIARTTRAATPPIVPPAIAPALLEDFGVDDASDTDQFSLSCALIVGAPEGGESGDNGGENIVEEDIGEEGIGEEDIGEENIGEEDIGEEDIREVENDEVLAFVGDAEAVLLTTKNPFFCLQHASARVPFPQQ